MSELSPIDWAVRPLKRYADFKGRAPRAEYWWFYLATLIIDRILSFIDKQIAGAEGPLSGIFWLIVLVPWLAVSVRRLHDTNRSSWWLAAIFLPIVALGFLAGAGLLDGDDGLSLAGWAAVLAVLVVAVTLFIFLVLPGTVGANRYGPDPYRPDEQLEEIFA